MALIDRLEREIEIIENDDSLTSEEKNKQIRELYREARDYEREQSQRDEY
jgi:hypothetical protein